MSKRKFFSILISLTILFLIIINIVYSNKKNDLIYIKEESNFNDFYFEDEYVVFDSDIKIKNSTSENHYFYMEADVSDDIGLTKEKTAIGYEKETDENIFFIKANSETVYLVKFKVLKGEQIEKADRLPPIDIIIKIK